MMGWFGLGWDAYQNGAAGKLQGLGRFLLLLVLPGLGPPATAVAMAALLRPGGRLPPAARVRPAAAAFLAARGRLLLRVLLLLLLFVVVLMPPDRVQVAHGLPRLLEGVAEARALVKGTRQLAGGRWRGSVLDLAGLDAAVANERAAVRVVLAPVAALAASDAAGRGRRAGVRRLGLAPLRRSGGCLPRLRLLLGERHRRRYVGVAAALLAVVSTSRRHLSSRVSGLW